MWGFESPRAHMSISRHLDAWLAEHGVRPDDAVVSEDPCAIFDGRVLDSEGREIHAPAPAGGGAPCEDAAVDEEPGLEDTVGMVRRLLSGE